MLSVRAPLATIADQQQLQLSPLKRLTLADKENTVRTAGLGVHWQAVRSRTREGGRCLPPLTLACLPTAPNPQQRPRPG